MYITTKRYSNNGIQALQYSLDLESQKTCLNLYPKDVQYLSLMMRKPAFCISKNKGAEKLRGNHAADQRLCFATI